MPDVLYADTSALVKLAVVEAETAAVRAELAAYDAVVSSVITEVGPRSDEREDGVGKNGHCSTLSIGSARRPSTSSRTPAIMRQ